MKNLLIRNIKLRKWTILIYAILLILSPLHLIISNDTIFTKVSYSCVAMLLLFISLKDSGHAFRFYSKLGHRRAYDFFGSLPVSKKDLLNANYITVLVFTLVGAGILSLYNMPDSNLADSDVNFNYTIPISYMTINFFAIPIAFKQFIERKAERISFLVYLLFMFILVPFAVAFSIIGITLLFQIDFSFLNKCEWLLNYGLLVLSIIFFVINYFMQIKKLKSH
ncbi:ABC-2 transporter permease [Staphylococcus sp. Marseille-Q5304]|uniref:phenol-soluble modulin export ABC transporter permease subunit PmtB n=1 Tax=Staphylococcus sp. Marseille-Q5304 TaxID=2942200 RepID=UPI0020749BEF|nr:ABC-2 transporter permease [Staphylococcus sp. Marseille-Q5304]